MIRVAVIDRRGRPEGEPSTDVVPWWSFTKTLIAVAALRLAEDGRLALDEPLAGAPYTLRQLLQHRAGVGDYGRLPEYQAAVARVDWPWTEEQLFARVSPVDLLFPPGTGWAYSNVGYLLVRRAVEKAYGAGLQQALNALILDPLHLRSSRVAATPDDMLATIFAGGHGYHPGWVFHGLVVGPAVEAALALHRLMTGDLLRPASRAAWLDRHSLDGAVAGRPWVTAGYGLGLMIGTMQCPGLEQPLHVAGHSAGGPGSVGAVYHRPDASSRRTVACFVADEGDGAAEQEALRRLAAS